MSILDQAELLLQAKNYSGSGDWLDESGNGHDAQLGSTGGADSNDPLFLPFAGDKYLWLPGSSGNYVSSPDSAAVSVTGDIDLRGRIRPDSWGSGAFFVVVARWVFSSTSDYLFYINVNGTLSVEWHDGSGKEKETSTVGAGTVFSDGDTGFVRVTLDVDNGASGYDVKFYTSSDGSSWTQLGDTVVGGATTAIRDSGAALEIGSTTNGTANNGTGRVYRVQVYDGIGGTLVFDANFADAVEPFATFTEVSSNAATVTVNRAASGYVSTVVDRDMWVLSTDDYLQVADDANLDFAAAESLTVVAAVRPNTVAAGSDVIVAKKNDLTTAAGYALYRSTAAVAGLVADGSADDVDTAGTMVAQTATAAAVVRNVTDDDIEAFKGGSGSGSPVTDSTTATLANALPLRIGATAGGTPANYFEGEIHAVAVFREALTDAEVALVGALLGNPGAPDPSELHLDALWGWIQQYDGRYSGADTELVGELNALNGTSDKEYAEARGTYLGVAPAG